MTNRLPYTTQKCTFCEHSLSHSLGAHTEVLQVNEDIGDTNDEDDEGEQPSTAAGAAAAAEDDDDTSQQQDNCCEVRLTPRADVALVPCECSTIDDLRFCTACAVTVASMVRALPICRSRIDMVLRVYK